MPKYTVLALFVVTCCILLVGEAYEEKWELYKRILIHNSECDRRTFVYQMSNILKYLLPEAPPCDDFNAFTCGDFEQSLSSTEKNKNIVSAYDRLKHKNERFFLDLMESVEKTSDPLSIQFAKLFYKNCLNHSLDSEFKEIKQIVQKFYIYYQLIKPDWALTAQLHWQFLLHMNSPFLSISIKPNLRNNSQMLLTISQGSPILNKKSRPVVTQYMMKHYAKEIGLQHVDEVFQLAEEMKQFYEEDGAKEYDNYTVMNLQTLSNYCPIILWKKMMAVIFLKRKQNILSDIVVAVVNPSKLSEVCDFLTPKLRTVKGRRILTSSIIWSFFIQMVPHLSRKERSMALLSGIPVSDFPLLKNEKEYCIQHLQNSLYFEFEKTYIEMFNSSANISRVASIFQNVKRSLLSMINNSKWIEPIDRENIIRKIFSVRAFIGYHHGEEYNWNKQSIFAHVNTTQTYIEQALYLAVIQRYYELQLLINNEKEERMVPVFRLSTDYSAISNCIRVPLGILQPPVYDERQSDEILYGSVGAIFGHQLMHAIDHMSRQFDENGLQPQFVSEHTIQVYNQKLECIKNQHTNYTFFEKRINVEKSLEEIVADIVGLQAAYKAYKTLSTQRNPHPLGTLLDLTSDQLFFVGFGQLWCSTMRRQIQTPVIINEHQTTYHNRVFSSIANNEGFQNAYNCNENSSVLQAESCQLW